MGCIPTVNNPVPLPTPTMIAGKWILTQTQAPGIGPPGVWSAANPSGQWMDIQTAGQISGTAFSAATGYQAIDSATLKITDPTQPVGYRLFNYHVDTAAHTLFFYIRMPNGLICTEGCGGYRFER